MRRQKGYQDEVGWEQQEGQESLVKSKRQMAIKSMVGRAHECEHERYFGKIATEAAIKSMLGAALPWASDHNQFQRHSHKTQDTDREAYSKVRLHGGPDRIQIKVGRRSMRMSRSRDWDMTGHITGTHQPWFFGPV